MLGEISMGVFEIFKAVDSAVREGVWSKIQNGHDHRTSDWVERAEVGIIVGDFR